MSSDADVFACIRAATADVTQKAQFVHLGSDQIAPYARLLAAVALALSPVRAVRRVPELAIEVLG